MADFERIVECMRAFMRVRIMKLSRLEEVDLREAWDSEAGAFKPWLAQEENIKLLGDVIGIDGNELTVAVYL